MEGLEQITKETIKAMRLGQKQGFITGMLFSAAAIFWIQTRHPKVKVRFGDHTIP